MTCSRTLCLVMTALLLVGIPVLATDNSEQPSVAIIAPSPDAPSQIEGDFDIQWRIIDTETEESSTSITTPSTDAPSQIEGVFPGLQWRIVDSSLLEDPMITTMSTTSVSVTSEWVKIYELLSNSSYKHFTTTFKSSEGPSSVSIQLDGYKDGKWQKAKSGTLNLGKSVVADLSSAYPVKIWVKKASEQSGSCVFVTNKS